MKSQRSYGTKALSKPKATMMLAQLLYGCPPERLASFTAQGLSASYNVPLATAERMLSEARIKRAAA